MAQFDTQIVPPYSLQPAPYRQLMDCWLGQDPEHEPWQEQVEHGLNTTRDLYLSAMHTQQLWASWSDKVVGDARDNFITMLSQLAAALPAAAGSLTPVRSAVIAGSCAYTSLSKASRQVSHFASANLSAAAIHAFKQGYRESRKHG